MAEPKPVCRMSAVEKTVPAFVPAQSQSAPLGFISLWLWATGSDETGGDEDQNEFRPGNLPTSCDQPKPKPKRLRAQKDQPGRSNKFMTEGS